MKDDLLRTLFHGLSEMRTVRADVEARSEPNAEAVIVAKLFKHQGVNVVENRGEWLLVAFWDHRTGERKQGWARRWYLPRGPQPAYLIGRVEAQRGARATPNESKY